MKRMYVSRDSNKEIRAFGLDPLSYNDLTASEEWILNNLKQAVSHSVLCRRAIRVYKEHLLKNVVTESERQYELLQIMLAGQGVK
jgi:hypothetical protein